MPAISTGPKCGSFCRPTMTSTPGGTCSSTSTPSKPSWRMASFARALMSPNSRRSSPGPFTPSRTEPLSVLWSMRSDETLTTTG